MQRHIAVQVHRSSSAWSTLLGQQHQHKIVQDSLSFQRIAEFPVHLSFMLLGFKPESNRST
jgi:hypothetical protein